MDLVKITRVSLRSPFLCQLPADEPISSTGRYRIASTNTIPTAFYVDQRALAGFIWRPPLHSASPYLSLRQRA